MPPRIPAAPRSSALAFPVRTRQRLAVHHAKSTDVGHAASFSTTVPRAGLSVIRREFQDWINNKEPQIGGRLYRFRPRNAPSRFVFWSTRYQSAAEGKVKYWIHRGDCSVTQMGAGKDAEISRPHNPFPLNPHFKSEPVLADGVREFIWRRVMRKGDSLKAVSADLHVDVRRIAAVVRLKEMEKEWKNSGKPLIALPYARAVMGMLPKWGGNLAKSGPFEPINEIYSHPHAGKVLFVPVPESRQFTRADAAKALHPDLLPADARVPHPELVRYEKALLDTGGQDEASHTAQSWRNFQSAVAKSENAVAQRAARKREAEEKATTHFAAKRCEFRFKDMNVDEGGWTGRSARGVGWRYGAPYTDRKRGQVKIPTIVE